MCLKGVEAVASTPFGGCWPWVFVSPASKALAALNTQNKHHVRCTALTPPHSALTIAHQQQHTGNLLLNRSLLSKVGDVGLSRLMPGARGRTAGGGSNSPLHAAPVSTVMDSRLVGTPCYMDPEYLRTGRFGPKSDVYSMGEWKELRAGGV